METFFRKRLLTIEDFRLGDTVKVKSDTSIHHNKVGTVKKLSETGRTVDVIFDDCSARFSPVELVRIKKGPKRK